MAAPVAALALAFALAGCALERVEQVRPPPAHAAARPRPTEAAQDLRDLNAAVTMVTELHYEEAAVILTVLADRFQAAGDRKHGAESLFWLGFCREKQQRFAEARDAYLRLMDSFAGTPAAQLGMQRLSRLPVPEPLRAETQPIPDA